MAPAIISADSHVTEPPGTYIDRIDRAWRDRAPRLVHDPKRGDIFVVDGMPKPVPMGLIAAAGKRADELSMFGAKFEELHRGGWDPEARLADQDTDGVAAEVIYPTVGMLLCNHPDFDYKHACFQAYNRWLAEFCGAHPDRLIGVGQTALRSVADGIADLEAIKALGLRGVMLPGNPNGPDYDDPSWAPFFEAAVDLGLPPSFHVLTSQQDTVRPRGPKLNSFMAFIRGNQDLIGVFIFGGVFERHPKLRLVCVEADAGWVPHFMYRMDHAYERHRAWLTSAALAKAPSEYFREHVYTTFQDDWVAFRMVDMLNVRRLLWANDFPHSDSTWPHSQELLARHTAHLTDAERQLVLHDNVAELYRLASPAPRAIRG
jgi:predicted TIM-barrel fold metal-dependent hydrolase